MMRTRAAEPGAPLAASTSELSWVPAGLSVISLRALVKASSFWKTTSSFRVTVSPVTGAGHGRAGSLDAQPFSISSA